MTVAVIVAGLVIGVLSSVAPLGPVTLMVLRRALRGDLRGAFQVGLGRVLPEMMYAGLATFGVAVLLEEVPRVRMAIELSGALVLVVVGALFVGVDHKAKDEGGDDGAQARSAFGAGFLVSALNPTLLVSWSLIVGLILGVAELTPTVAQKLLFPLSLGAGIALGYVVLVWTVARWGANLEERAVEIVLRTIGGVLIALGIWHALSMARGF